MVDKQNTLPERLKNLRKIRGLSLAALGDKVGVSAQAVHKWENGGQIDASRRLALAKALSVSIEWFADPEGDNNDQYEGFPEFTSAVSFAGESFVPLMPPELMLQWLVGNGKRIQGFERITCPVSHGPRAFAMEIRDSSMEGGPGSRSYAPGDYIFVDPDIDYRPNTRVVVYDPNEPESCFVVMRELYDIDDEWHMRALNPSWKNKGRKLLAEDVLAGTVIGTWRSE